MSNTVEIMQKFQRKPEDTGSPEVQIALLTEQVTKLTAHLQTHRKDKATQRGLMKAVNVRRSMMKYLKRVNAATYETVCTALGLRR